MKINFYGHFQRKRKKVFIFTSVLLILKEYLVPMKSCTMKNEEFLIFMLLAIMIS